MELNFNRVFGPDIASKIQRNKRIWQCIKNISKNNDFSIGDIKNNKLQIFSNPYNIARLRRHEDQILYAIGNDFDFSMIEWRTRKTVERATPKLEQAIIRTTPQKGIIKNIAKKCSHAKLKAALTKLSKTLDQSSI